MQHTINRLRQLRDEQLAPLDQRPLPHKEPVPLTDLTVQPANQQFGASDVRELVGEYDTLAQALYVARRRTEPWIVLVHDRFYLYTV